MSGQPACVPKTRTQSPQSNAATTPATMRKKVRKRNTAVLDDSDSDSDSGGDEPLMKRTLLPRAVKPRASSPVSGEFSAVKKRRLDSAPITYSRPQTLRKRVQTAVNPVSQSTNPGDKQ